MTKNKIKEYFIYSVLLLSTIIVISIFLYLAYLYPELWFLYFIIIVGSMIVN
jgi:hypothetical protein